MISAARTRKDTPKDVGTLWIMRRSHHSARCALMERLGHWELRIIIDGEMLLSERCRRGAAAFALAERWKGRMFADGWRQVLPETAGQTG
jgi:hypothetical protein